MKLASYRDGSRDGQLVVVSRDLSSAHYATGIATRLQQVLDDWNFLSPQLEVLSQNLNHGRARHAFAFDTAQCLAPLPRAFACIVDDGASRCRREASDRFMASHDCLAGETIEVAARLAAVVGDVAAGTAPGSAVDGVRLVLLAAEVVDGQATAFGPVALTPDELAPAWQAGRLDLGVEMRIDGRRVDVGATAEPQVGLGEVIAQAAAQCGLAAGSIVCGRLLQLAALHAGARLRVAIKSTDGGCLFGDIELRVAAADSPA